MNKGSKVLNINSEKTNYFGERSNMREYFTPLKIRLTIGLLIAFLVPYIALSTYFHFQFNSTLKETEKLNLEALSESQRNTIDLFLQERVVNLFSLFHSREFSLTPSVHKMEYYLENLRQVSDSFIDVGFLNAEGIQIGYAGSYPYLQGKNYIKEKWFETFINQDQDYFISDIYLGFRNKPHFTIATKQKIDGNYYIIRSTLDPDKFYIFLRSISHGKKIESALINNKGLYQVVDPDMGKLLGQSDYIPPVSDRSGVKDIKNNGDSILIAYTWLKETPWALLVRQPLNIVHTKMYKARRIMATILMFILLIIAGHIWFTTNQLINNAQTTEKKRDECRNDLQHASKLASVGELATGVAHEINNPLAIITATSGVIKDMLNPEFDLDGSPENILQELETIDSAAFRARGITYQLLDFARKNAHRLVECNVNEILEEVLKGLIEREFEIANIAIKRNYTPDLPEIQLDPDKIKQVFLNLINNAGDAIVESGKITISTSYDAQNVRITVNDTGQGMTSDQIEKIFTPFYTTKEVGKGTGLGLSVSLSIIEQMNGKIEVQSMPGTGSSFIVTLPIHNQSGAEDGSTTSNGK